jgi:hypothetical protein
MARASVEFFQVLQVHRLAFEGNAHRHARWGLSPRLSEARRLRENRPRLHLRQPIHWNPSSVRRPTFQEVNCVETRGRSWRRGNEGRLHK